MVLYRRNRVEGGTYVFTVTLADRGSSMLVDHIPALRTAFRISKCERPFSIDAIVVLPEHLHALMTLPPDDADYSGLWRRIKAVFSRSVARSTPIRRDNRGEYQLWQRRFSEHTIRGDTDFERHADYIHYNPVRHGLVSRVSDWPYSSFHRFVRLGVLPADWGGDARATTQDFGERAG